MTFNSREKFYKKLLRYLGEKVVRYVKQFICEWWSFLVIAAVVGTLLVFSFDGISVDNKVLAIVAISSPFILICLQHLYSWHNRPKLEISFKHDRPYCVITSLHITPKYNCKQEIITEAFYCNFIVHNKGKTAAHDCEAILESVQNLKDKKQNKGRWNKFIGVNLRWALPPEEKQEILRTIYPDRKVYGNIGHLTHKDYNHLEKPYYINEEDMGKLKFFFEIAKTPYRQPDYICNGKYEIEIALYSKDIKKKVPQKFTIEWSGEWKDDEDEMRKELKIKKWNSNNDKLKENKKDKP